MAAKLINVIGVESTGKTTLSEQLAAKLGYTYIPEYARTFIGSLSEPVTAADVKIIANKQLEQYEAAASGRDKGYVFDTTIITSIIWLYDKYALTDLTYHKAYLSQRFDLTLLCVPDLPWQYDAQRSDEHRLDYLHQLHLDYLNRNGKTYQLVSGSDISRLEKINLSTLQ